MECVVCATEVPDGYPSLADHFAEMAEASEPSHVMWLNRNVTKDQGDVASLAPALREYFRGPRPLARWMKDTFIQRFLGDEPHPLVVALQRPTRAVLLGYVVEHRHFLRQWVRSCAHVLAKTDKLEVVHYEIDNIVTEFGGTSDAPSHYELLLRMGESLGLSRAEILATEPLPPTRAALRYWRNLAETGHWVEVMAAMHGLELIANHALTKEGASLAYFDPAILEDEAYPQAVKDFLREGYEADVGHSEEALDMVDRYAREYDLEDRVKTTFQESLDHFDAYLRARLQRGAEYEDA